MNSNKNIDVKPTDTFKDLVKKFKDGDRMCTMGEAEIKNWYGSTKITMFPGMGSRLDMAKKLLESKYSMEGFVDFAAGVLCFIHLAFMRAIESKTTQKKHEEKPMGLMEALIAMRNPPQKTERKFMTDGVDLFNIALQLEMVIKNTFKNDEMLPFVNLMKQISEDDDCVFEIELVKFLTGVFNTYQIVGSNLKDSMITIQTNDEMHWMVMKELLNTKKGTFAH